MKIIRFTSIVPGTLADQFVGGFTSMSVRRLRKGSGPIDFIFFWRADGTGLKIQSVMHDINREEWLEAGVLEFTHVAADDDPSSQIELPDEFRRDLKVSKLVLSTEEMVVESGIVLEGRDGGRIVVVAGGFPYAITIAADFLTETFDPEYELSEYSQELLNG